MLKDTLQEIGDLDELPDDSEVTVTHKPPKGMVPAPRPKPAAGGRVDAVDAAVEPGGETSRAGTDAGDAGAGAGADAGAGALVAAAADDGGEPVLSTPTPIERVRRAYAARQQQQHRSGSNQRGQPCHADAAESERLSAHLSSLRAREDPKYVEIRDQKKRLPAHSMKSEIVSTIKHNQVVVISGSTGCGKTTQVPQFILEDAIAAGAGAECTILCTQPRRISAVGVADRGT